MMNKLKFFYLDVTGATAVEYSVMAAGIGMVIFGGLSAIGVDISGAFSTVDAAIK